MVGWGGWEGESGDVGGWEEASGDLTVPAVSGWL